MKQKRKKILIVEDEIEQLNVLTDKFTQEGFIIIKALNGREAVKVALFKKPDIILLDIVMPVMDGVTALEKIRANKKGKDIPVVILTNLSDAEKMERARKQGVNDYLVKTDWTLEDVVKKVRRKIKRT